MESWYGVDDLIQQGAEENFGPGTEKFLKEAEEKQFPLLSTKLGAEAAPRSESLGKARESSGKTQNLSLFGIEQNVYRWIKDLTGQPYEGVDYLDVSMAIKALRVNAGDLPA